MDYIALGGRIRRRRRMMKITQAELAMYTGLSRPYVGLVERGERKLSVETLVAIANTLGTGADYLLGEELLVVQEEMNNGRMLKRAEDAMGLSEEDDGFAAPEDKESAVVLDLSSPGPD